MRVPISRPNGKNAKYAAVGVVAILEVAAVLYVVLYPPVYTGPQYIIPPPPKASTTTTTSTHTHVPPNAIQVNSAIIQNGSLILDALNKGPAQTTTLQVTYVCGPGFVHCLNYKKLVGSSYIAVYVLPVGREFKASFAGICFFPIQSCKKYHPVNMSSYYLDLQVGFVSGAPVNLQVTPVANNTWAPLTSVVDIGSKLTAFKGNLTGNLNMTVMVNSNVPAVNYTLSINTFKTNSSGYSYVLASNRTGCGGSLGASCTPLVTLLSFNTVQTGIYPGLFFGIVVHDLNVTSTYFAAWDEAGAG